MDDQTMRVTGEQTEMSTGDITQIEIGIAHENNHGMHSHATTPGYTVAYVKNQDGQFVLKEMKQHNHAAPTDKVDQESLEVLRFATGYIMSYYDVPVNSPFDTDE
jgi:hypothetical protein